MSERLIMPPHEWQEWQLAVDNIIEQYGKEQAQALLEQLMDKKISHSGYQNSFITPKDYPGNLEAEQEFESFLRWNSALMVARAQDDELGGHISTYASIATLYEVGFWHFWRSGPLPDLIFYQGHSSPGIYARSYLEYRFDTEDLEHFRQDLQDHGLSSYPHPWLMPTYWSFPTVSMGLGPLQAIYQARLKHYLENLGLISRTDRKIWCFCGDGEMDEPESTSGIRFAAREGLSDLIFVINCNLQRLDGPVRGNSKVIDEFDALFRSAGWHVVRAIWSRSFEEILEYDSEQLILKRLDELVDGQLQLYQHQGLEFFKKDFFNTQQLQDLLQKIPNELLEQWVPAAHDRRVVYTAYQQALSEKNRPTVILFQSVKGWSLGQYQGANTTHNLKTFDLQQRQEAAKRWSLSLPKKVVDEGLFYRPAQDDPLIKAEKVARDTLGGFLPQRPEPLTIWPQRELSLVESFKNGSADKSFSTTMALVRIMTTLLRDKAWGKYVVPIVADEARTFGMEGLFRSIGIYAPKGQQYTPVDAQDLMPYKESIQGRLLQEGINEAGAMASWLAAATAYTHYHLPLCPFYTFYSMFGFQRTGDLFWAAGDSRARGFLIGATAGRTTLNGEGLQHQDGHSHLAVSAVPTARCYDPAFAFELAVIIEHGLDRFASGHDEFYYITTMNENYPHLAMPIDSREGIIQGGYCLQPAHKPALSLLGSGAILWEVIRAADVLRQKFQLSVEVLSITSFTELRRHALLQERLEPEIPPYVATLLEGNLGPVIAATDYIRLHADQIARWIKRPYYVLGTDGFGRSGSREQLRRHFEVAATDIVATALEALIAQGSDTNGHFKKALSDYHKKKNHPLAL